MRVAQVSSYSQLKRIPSISILLVHQIADVKQFGSFFNVWAPVNLLHISPDLVLAGVLQCAPAVRG